MTPASGPVSTFIDRHFRHFNAAVLKDAADAYTRHLDNGGQMLITLAGAMSTAELGLSLAEMIRRGKVHAISCTGANLEEDLFNLVAHSHYERVPHYRYLTAEDEQRLLDRHLNRVAESYARTLAKRGELTHGNFRKRMVRAGVRMPAAENIAVGQETPKGVVKDWTRSPGHFRNMTSAKFKRIGVGYHDKYWVQIFSVQ